MPTTTTTKSDSQSSGKAETILVTGATSMVGSEVVKQLLRSTTKDVNIKAAGRSVENVKRVVNSDRTKPIQIDYYKQETLREAVKDVDRVFIVTPFQSDMVELTSNLLREIKNVGNIKKIVKLSVLRGDDAAADSDIIADRLHRQAEKMIEDSGISYTFLCPTFFMQSFATFFPQNIKEQGAFYLPAGDGKVSFVDARDIAAVAVQALTNDNNNNGRHNGKAYNITGPEAISFGQAARILSEQVGKKISYVSISEDDARKGMRDIGWDEWRINFLIELYNIIRLGYLSDVFSSTVEEVTRKRATSFSQFAKDYAEAFR
jgi:uncharacterized protein YbjT (DUF2867 family)